MPMELEPIPLSGWPFDLAATLGSGQVFHWNSWNGGWVGAIGNEAVFLRQSGPLLLECSAGKSAVVRHYLGLDDDMKAIVADFRADDVALHRAVSWCPGLRMIRQPVWECLATFITSSLKQVPQIRAISLRLRERLGAAVQEPGLPVVWSYPGPEAVVAAGEALLRECGLGYRAAFLHRSAAAVAEGSCDLGLVAGLGDAEAGQALCRLHGVGDKVAACVLLFGYGRSGAFPIDVWIERVLRELYFPRARKLTAARLDRFAWKQFGARRGIAQQFLFHWARLTDCGRREVGPDGEVRVEEVRVEEVRVEE
jgi:N-glycosylase/DNA lyase